MNKNAILIDALELLLEVEKSELENTVSKLKRENHTLLFQTMDNFITDRTMVENDGINDIVEILADLKRDYQFDMSIEIMEEFEGRYGFFRSQYSLHDFFILHYKRLSIKDCTRILTILKPA